MVLTDGQSKITQLGVFSSSSTDPATPLTGNCYGTAETAPSCVIENSLQGDFDSTYRYFPNTLANYRNPAADSLLIPDVTKLATGNKVGPYLTIASIAPAPGESSPVSNTNYDIVFSGTVVTSANLIVGDTDGTPNYSLAKANAVLWKDLPIINNITPSDGQTLIGPHSGFSMQNTFGKYNTDYFNTSVLSGTFGISGLEYVYHPANATNNNTAYPSLSASLVSASNPLLLK